MTTNSLLGVLTHVCLIVVSTPCLALHPKTEAQCKVYFAVVEHDEQTSNLNMTGLTAPQKKWWEKHGANESPGICLLNGDSSGERITAESSDDSYVKRIIGSAPLYSIAWEEHRISVPDNDGGHYAFSAHGILSIYDPKANNGTGDFKAITPIHDTNHTIFSSSATSLLKEAIGEIKRRASSVLADARP